MQQKLHHRTFLFLVQEEASVATTPQLFPDSSQLEFVRPTAPNCGKELDQMRPDHMHQQAPYSL